MSATANDGLRCSPFSSFQQHPSISVHGRDASCTSVSSGSPRMATSQFSFRSVAAGVAEGCGPIATFTLRPQAPQTICGETANRGEDNPKKSNGEQFEKTRKWGENQPTDRRPLLSFAFPTWRTSRL